MKKAPGSGPGLSPSGSGSQFDRTRVGLGSRISTFLGSGSGPRALTLLGHKKTCARSSLLCVDDDNYHGSKLVSIMQECVCFISGYLHSCNSHSSSRNLYAIINSITFVFIFFLRTKETSKLPNKVCFFSLSSEYGSKEKRQCKTNSILLSSMDK